MGVPPKAYCRSLYQKVESWMIWGYPNLRKPPDIDTENIREQQHELDFSKIQE